MSALITSPAFVIRLNFVRVEPTYVSSDTPKNVTHAPHLGPWVELCLVITLGRIGVLQAGNACTLHSILCACMPRMKRDDMQEFYVHNQRDSRQATHAQESLCFFFFYTGVCMAHESAHCSKCAQFVRTHIGWKILASTATHWMEKIGINCNT